MFLFLLPDRPLQLAFFRQNLRREALRDVLDSIALRLPGSHVLRETMWMFWWVRCLGQLVAGGRGTLHRMPGPGEPGPFSLVQSPLMFEQLLVCAGVFGRSIVVPHSGAGLG